MDLAALIVDDTLDTSSLPSPFRSIVCNGIELRKSLDETARVASSALGQDTKNRLALTKVE